MTIEPISKERMPEVIDVHMRAFPGFFLTFLGCGFLKEFYSSFCGSNEGIGFVAIDPETGRVAGVVVGPVQPAGYFKRLLKRRWWAFCLHSTKAVCRRPTIIPRMMRAFLYRGDAPEGSARALLSSIAVDPEIQRGGVGRQLVQAYLDEARRRGVPGVFLTTDRDGNEAVNGFYQKLGWRIDSTFTTPQGRRMNRYVWDFDEAPPTHVPADAEETA
jgi:ribosomal protein S18 acetylase RimI-like enzyme